MRIQTRSTWIFAPITESLPCLLSLSCSSIWEQDHFLRLNPGDLETQMNDASIASDLQSNPNAQTFRSAVTGSAPTGIGSVATSSRFAHQNFFQQEEWFDRG